MTSVKPNFETRAGGWASLSEENVQLGSYGAKPPESAPEIRDAKPPLPELLIARFYFWDKVSEALSEIVGDPDSTYRLNAIDVALSKTSDTSLSILLSTRTPAFLNKKGGVLESLAKIIDPDAKRWRDVISMDSDHHRFSDADIFLWLASRSIAGGKLDPQITLTHISGISGTDSAARTAELRSGIDFDRSNFLTSVAEGDTLGPVDLNMTISRAHGNEHYTAVIFLDGGFKIKRSETYIPGILDGGELMLAANVSMAHDILRRIEHAYIADGPHWKTEREAVIETAIKDLRDRYELAHKALEDAKKRKPEAS
ncbi:hypothetical protein [uncultured Brachybacterium sp.]|uniref:hypothetical protein n=1 Tax=uncultured Brachybacterium sp. TaxID=189680 RepID=UPI00262F5485|nr:hypothetical protein [uncultured Brachybacterium sp.]